MTSADALDAAPRRRHRYRPDRDLDRAGGRPRGVRGPRMGRRPAHPAATRRGHRPRAARDLEEAVRDAEVVVVATPIPTIADLVATGARRGAGGRRDRRRQHQGSRRGWRSSARGWSAARSAALRPRSSHGRQRALGARPRVGVARGRHRVGPHPHRTERSAPSSTRLETWVTRLGARPVRMDPLRHDRLVAFVSHLPQVASTALMALAATRGVRRTRDPPARGRRLPRPHAARVLQPAAVERHPAGEPRPGRRGDRPLRRASLGAPARRRSCGTRR